MMSNIFLQRGAHGTLEQGGCVMNAADLERFVSRVPVSEPDACWEWQGAVMWKGYGTFSLNRRPVRAHRLAYQLAHGSIPDGLHIDHLCRNRRCVNPAHLEAVTPRENLMRSPIAPAKLNVDKGSCPHGHPYTPENTYVRKTGRDAGARICRTCVRIRKGRRAA